MSRADRQAGRQALAGLMLSLSTVMVLLCHPSRESITVSLRLAARHRKRLAQKGEEESGKEKDKEHH